MGNVFRPPCDEGVIRAGPAGAPCGGERAPWVLVATILGSSMAFIDGTFVNVALPAVQRDLNATFVEAQWVVEAYGLCLASLILVGGALGDRAGRRRVFVAGLVLFTLASLACGLAATMAQLIAARAVQGLGGALLVPASLAIISASFEGAARGWAIGVWSGWTAITSAIGPVLGGWFVEHVSWRAVFFVNAPIAAITLAVALLRVPESRDPTSATRLDWQGALLATAGVGAIVFGLIRASDVGLGDGVVLALLAVGGLIVIAFVAVEARSRQPMVPLALFRSRTFSGVNLLTLLLYGGLGGALFFVPFDLIRIQRYSATAAGLALLPFILVNFLLAPWAGTLVGRYGARKPLVIGPIIAAAGFGLYAAPGIGGSYWTTFFPPAVVLGLGMAVTIAPLTTTVMGAVDTRHAGVASGINNAVARLAGLLAVAVFGIVLLGVLRANLERRAASLALPEPARQQVFAEGSRLASQRPADEERSAAAIALDESFVAGFRAVMVLASGLALGGALCARLLVPPPPSS